MCKFHTLQQPCNGSAKNSVTINTVSRWLLPPRRSPHSKLTSPIVLIPSPHLREGMPCRRALLCPYCACPHTGPVTTVTAHPAARPLPLYRPCAMPCVSLTRRVSVRFTVSTTSLCKMSTIAMPVIGADAPGSEEPTEIKMNNQQMDQAMPVRAPDQATPCSSLWPLACTKRPHT